MPEQQKKTAQMFRPFVLVTLISLGLAACGAPQPQFGPDGKPLPRVYRISERDTAKIQFRVLDSINTLRSARGAQTMALSSELNAAALTHSRDMAVQNRPWHFGSDGSSPLDRVRRAGYSGRMLGENISETYESELETLSAWMEMPDQREVLLDPRARDLGIAWFQEPNGKIWWTLITGQPSGGTSLIN